MAQWRKVLATEPEGGPDSDPGSHMVGGEDWLTSCPLTTREYTQKKSM